MWIDCCRIMIKSLNVNNKLNFSLNLNPRFFFEYFLNRMVISLGCGIVLESDFEGKSVPGIVFHGIALTEKVIANIQMEVDTASIKRLKINYVDVQGEFYETVLRHFPNLKILQIEPEENKIIGTSNEWMTQQCPKLECFHWRGFSETIHELITFIEVNPTIRTLCINADLIYSNKERFMQSRVFIAFFFLHRFTFFFHSFH